MNTATESETRLPAAKANRIYDVRDQVSIELPDRGQLDLWLPVISDSRYQRILEVDVAAPGGWDLRKESAYGNSILHWLSRRRDPRSSSR